MARGDKRQRFVRDLDLQLGVDELKFVVEMWEILVTLSLPTLHLWAEKGHYGGGLGSFVPVALRGGFFFLKEGIRGT